MMLRWTHMCLLCFFFFVSGTAIASHFFIWILDLLLSLFQVKLGELEDFEINAINDKLHRSYNVTYGVQAPSWQGNMTENPHLVHN